MLLKQIFSLFILTIFIQFSLNADGDTSMSQKKKETKIYPMGQKIFQKKCQQDIDMRIYKDIDSLKNEIKTKICKPLKDNHLEALSLYLWEVKRFEDSTKKIKQIKVLKSDKCPVCGMYIYKYPKWASQIYYSDKHYSFDGIKDLMKYYFEHTKDIEAILVSDYYTQKVIEAREAFFVVGSDVYGPMGDELIAFESEVSAKTFMRDHKGLKIMHFSEISSEDVHKLDE